MTEERRTAIMKRAIDTYGQSAQLDLVVEEMAELTKAISKLRRARPGPEFRATVENIVEETADVQIMIDQLRMILAFSTTLAEEEKLQRLDGRLGVYAVEKGMVRDTTSHGSPGWWSRIPGIVCTSEEGVGASE